MVKKLALFGGIPLLALVLFASGTWYGANLVTDMNSTHLLTKYVTRLGIQYYLVKSLDQGKIKDATRLLNTLIDSDILIADTLVKYVSYEPHKGTVRNLFRKIAEHRKTYPAQKRRDESINAILRSSMEKEK